VIICGDWVVDSGEACDDGLWNSNSEPDACRNLCVLASCGDWVIDSGEECDWSTSGTDCSSTCEILFWATTSITKSLCGNWIVESGEECDDWANGDNTDWCTDSCFAIVEEIVVESKECGNWIVESGEECDDWANWNDTDWCTDSCFAIVKEIEPELPGAVCGNALVEENEECDDGNTANGDWCTELCQKEYVFPVIIEEPLILTVPEEYLDTWITDDFDLILKDAWYNTFVKNKTVATAAPEWFTTDHPSDEKTLASLQYWYESVPTALWEKYYADAEALIAIPSVGIFVPINYPTVDWLTDPNDKKSHLAYLDYWIVHRAGTDTLWNDQGTILLEWHAAALHKKNKWPFGAAMKSAVLADVWERVYTFVQTWEWYETHIYEIFEKEQVAPNDLEPVAEGTPWNLVISSCGIDNLVWSLDWRNLLIARPVASNTTSVSEYYITQSRKKILDSRLNLLLEDKSSEEIVSIHEILKNSQGRFREISGWYNIYRYLIERLEEEIL